jgi:putative redox protein
MRTSTKWIKEQQFESRQDHNSLKFDGARKHGISPKAVLLSGLAACSGIDVVEILQKMRVEFTSLEIETQATMTKDVPQIFQEIEVVFRIKTEPVNRKKIIKAIELSLEKYCGVAIMLRKNSPINYRLVIED